MRYKSILVTGGAGFIGSHLVDRLVTMGLRVSILDNLEEQIHRGVTPAYLNKRAKFIRGDIRNYLVFQDALKGVDVVFHLASRVGVGQSNYEIKSYVDANVGGMANFLDIVVNRKLSIKKVIMTASMTSYGEGNYSCKVCGIVKPNLRNVEQLRKKEWEPCCSFCKRALRPVATDESASINNNSIYALTKNVQEELLKLIGTTYKVPFVSLRCFNAYGPRQSLSNPYTGVTAIFISRLKNNKRPVIYEDGNQTRDFISVHDVVDALIASMESDNADYEIINIGSGKPTSIRAIAMTLAKLMRKRIEPYITYKFRVNDIRHCYADIAKAKKLLNWEPKVSVEEGLSELVSWSRREQSIDLFEKAEKELRNKSLL